MSESVLTTLLRKVLAVASASMLIATLSAIAIVKAQHRTREVAVAPAGSSAPSAGVGNDTSAIPLPPSELPATDNGTSTGGPSPVVTGPSSSNHTANVSNATLRPAQAGPNASNVATPSSGTDCPDYNPNQGVFCDHYLIGGTTVLSGPLAVYGQAGLKGGQAWLTYFNSQVAPKLGLRQVKLIWYDDNLDPNKTLQYVQRLNEVDHVFYLSGITSPEAAAPYLLSAPCSSRPGHDDCPLAGGKGLPLIGDIGLSPKSYTSPLIFPTAPSPPEQAFQWAKYVSTTVHVTKISVIQDVLPGVDSTPFRQAWADATKRYGLTLSAYREIASTASDCSAQFNAVTAPQPGWVYLPIAAPPMLACLRAAKTSAVQPGSPSSSWLKGWHGGSGLQIEVDNCKPTCDGMVTGNLFLDPHTDPSPQMATYRANMARYAPDVDIAGFIPTNYYHDGWVIQNLLQSAGINANLTRKTIFEAANRFGPFDTGFGNTVTWRPDLPRVPTKCAYVMTVRGDKWSYNSQQICLD